MKLEIENLKGDELKLAEPAHFNSAKMKVAEGLKKAKSETQLKQDTANITNKAFYDQLAEKQEKSLDLAMYDSMKVNPKMVYYKAFKKAIIVGALLAAAAYFLVPHKYFYFLEYLRPVQKITIVDQPSDAFKSLLEKRKDSISGERNANILEPEYFKKIRCHEFSNLINTQIKYSYVSKNEMYHFYNCLIQSATLMASPDVYTVKRQMMIEKRLNKKTVGISALDFAMAEATPKLPTSRYARARINNACLKWLRSDGCILRLVYEFAKGNIELVKDRLVQLSQKPSDLSSQAEEYARYLSLMVGIYNPNKDLTSVFSGVELEAFKISYVKLRILEQFAMRFYREKNNEKVEEIIKIAQIHFDRHMLQRSGKLRVLSFLSNQSNDDSFEQLFAEDSVLKYFIHDKSLVKLVANTAVEKKETKLLLFYIEKYHNEPIAVFKKQNEFDKKMWLARIAASVDIKNRKDLFTRVSDLQKLKISRKDLEFNLMLGLYNVLVSVNDRKLAANLKVVSSWLRKQDKSKVWQHDFAQAVYFISLKNFEKARLTITKLKKLGYRAEYWAEQASLFLSAHLGDMDELTAQQELVISKFGPSHLTDYIEKTYLTSEDQRKKALLKPREMIKAWLMQLTFDKHQVPLTGMGFIL